MLIEQNKKFIEQIDAISRRNEKVLSDLTKSIEKTTETFLKKVEDSDKWHQKHSEKLDKVYWEVVEVKTILTSRL